MCPRLGLIPRAILSFDEQGRLVALESDVSKLDSLQGIEFFSGVLVPGMVNAHGHLELSYLKNKIPVGTGLAGFVRGVAELRHGTDEPERVYAADVQDSLMYSEGIVAVGDICNDAFTFSLKKKSPIHYHNFIEVFGIDPAIAAGAFMHGKTVAAVSGHDGLPFSLTPHSLYSVSQPLLEAVVAENTARKPLSIHFMESRAESELFQDKGLFAERYRKDGLSVDFSVFGSPAGRLTASVPSDTPLILVHNTFVTEEDIDRIQSHFDNVTWVICPRSNDYIEGEFPPVGLLRRKGCRIALGTDSLSSNTSLSLLDEMKFLTARQPELSLPEMIMWATRGGAEALGLDAWAGTFEIGMSPGAVLIDCIDWDRMSLTPESTARRIV